jgi:hypothetical protein
MNVLVFNPGSGSLKFELISSEPPIGDAVRGRKIVRGIVEPIWDGAQLSLFERQPTIAEEPVSVRDYGEAAAAILAKPRSNRSHWISSLSAWCTAAHATRRRYMSMMR